MPDATPDQLIYDEAVRAIGWQRSMTAELRSGASILIATAAIAISMLDAQAFDAPGAPFAWLAVVAFALVSVSALAVIWPRRSVHTAHDVGWLVRTLTAKRGHEDRLKSAEVRRQLTLDLAAHQRLNAWHISNLSRASRAGGVALIVQIAATVAARIAGA